MISLLLFNCSSLQRVPFYFFCLQLKMPYSMFIFTNELYIYTTRGGSIECRFISICPIDLNYCHSTCLLFFITCRLKWRSNRNGWQQKFSNIIDKWSDDKKYKEKTVMSSFSMSYGWVSLLVRTVGYICWQNNNDKKDLNKKSNQLLTRWLEW